MIAIIYYIDEPYRSRLQWLGKVVVKSDIRRARKSADKAIDLLNMLNRKTACRDLKQIHLKLVYAFCAASHPKRKSFDLDQLKRRLDIPLSY